MPTARQLEIFIAVVENGSIRAAADQLGISQPSISKQINAFEAKLGLRLFERRRGSKAALSQRGNELIDDAKKALALQKLMVKGKARPYPKQITVLVRHYLFTVLEKWIDDLVLEDFGTELKFKIVDSHAPVAEMVAGQKAWVGLVRETRSTLEGSAVTDIVEVAPCGLVVSPDCLEKYADGQIIPVGLPILLPGPGSLSDWIMVHLKAAGISEDRFKFGPPFIASLLRQVLDGRGAGVFMINNIAKLIDRGELVLLDMEIGPLYLHFIRHSELNPLLAEAILQKLTKDFQARANPFPFGVTS